MTYLISRTSYGILIKTMELIIIVSILLYDYIPAIYKQECIKRKALKCVGIVLVKY